MEGISSRFNLKRDDSQSGFTTLHSSRSCLDPRCTLKENMKMNGRKGNRKLNYRLQTLPYRKIIFNLEYKAYFLCFSFK